MIVYTDGACSGNGSADAVGGFAVVVLDDDENLITTYSRCNEKTTNNKEELRAILYVMFKYGKDEHPIVYSDSAYAVNTLNDYMFRWANNNWTKSDKKVPENLELIQNFYILYYKGYRIDLRKCKGHVGSKWNELADKLAVAAKEGKEINNV